MQEELLFCPLGGSGEIGMNMNLFAYGKPDNQKWIMVDIGVTFADDTIPGIDLIYPDPGFIIDKKDDLLGIVLTHAHEDHSTYMASDKMQNFFYSFYCCSNQRKI